MRISTECPLLCEEEEIPKTMENSMMQSEDQVRAFAITAVVFPKCKDTLLCIGITIVIQHGRS